MKVRAIALLIAVPAVIAGLLVASPTAAASYSTRVPTDYVSILSTGYGKVSMKCTTSSRCRGTIYFDGSYSSRRSFSVAGRSSAYVTVKLNPGDAADPHANGVQTGDNYHKALPSPVKLFVNEDSPRNVTVHNWVTTETQVSSRTPTIEGNISPALALASGRMTNLKVDLVEYRSGGSLREVGTRSVEENGSFTFTSRLGTNNSSGRPYRLRIRGIDSDGNPRSWWWRGRDGNAAGGGRYFYEASVVRSSKYGPFNADFHYSSINGSVDAGTEVSVAAKPSSYANASNRRELDLTGCANVYGKTVADSAGKFQLDFLPVDDASKSPRYMLGAKKGSVEAWYGASGKGPFGSCFDVLDYSSYSTADLIELGPDAIAPRGTLENFGPSGNTLNIRTKPVSGFTPTSAGDKWVRLRERIPGVRILDSPVVMEGAGSFHSNRTITKNFANVPPGDYYIEVGRRTGCATWYASKYSNNSAYFSGLDRGAERWKSFRTLQSLPGNSKSGLEGIAVRHGATYSSQGRVRSGYAGWMYREYCKAYGAGTINSMTNAISGFDNAATFRETSTNKKGAIVKGRVTRTKGRTNKEMLVRVSSSDGTRVLRTDLTDSKGYFYIAGLPSGNWTVSVNTDSWRGIGRSFTGKHSVRVRTGRTYSVGTLKFRG